MKQFGLSKNERLTSKKSIAQVFEKGRQYSNSYILAKWLLVKNDNPPVFRVGFSVPKRKISSAVKRNRVKRLLRESFRLSKYIIIDGAIMNGYRLEVMLVYLREEIPTFDMLKPQVEHVLRALDERIAKIQK